MARSQGSERTTLSVKDFGPIAEATVELRPFTVFVGASNTGKSYLAILLYALHQFFGRFGSPLGPAHLPSRLSPLPHAAGEMSDEQIAATSLWLQSHLHPAMQVSFTRILATAVKAGVRVVVTTHSEWVLEALANLVRLSDVAKSRRSEVAAGGPALSADEVGAWHFEPKERPKGSVVREIPLDTVRGTFPAGFGEITEQLYNDWAKISNLCQA